MKDTTLPSYTLAHLSKTELRVSMNGFKSILADIDAGRLTPDQSEIAKLEMDYRRYYDEFIQRIKNKQ